MPKNYNSTVVFYRAAMTMEDMITLAEVLGWEEPDNWTFPESPIVPLLRYVLDRNRYAVLSQDMIDRFYSVNLYRRYILKLVTFEQEDTGHMHVALNVVNQGSFMETTPVVRHSNYLPAGYSEVVLTLSTNAEPNTFNQPHSLDCDRHSPRMAYLLADPDTSLHFATVVKMYNPNLLRGINPDMSTAPGSFFVPDGFSVVPWDAAPWYMPVPFAGEDIAFDLAGGDAVNPPFLVSAARQGDGYSPALERL